MVRLYSNFNPVFLGSRTSQKLHRSLYFLVNGFSFISAKKRCKSFMVFAAKIYCMRKFSHVVVKCRIITHTHSFGFSKICEKTETLTHSLVFLTSFHTTPHNSIELFKIFFSLLTLKCFFGKS